MTDREVYFNVRFRGINEGRMEAWEVLRDLGYRPDGRGGYENISGIREYAPPPWVGMPIGTRNRMDPGIVRVYNDAGEQLSFVREYSIDGPCDNGCVYAEFTDNIGQRYFFMGTDESDLMSRIEANTRKHEMNHNTDRSERNSQRQNHGQEMIM